MKRFELLQRKVILKGKIGSIENFSITKFQNKIINYNKLRIDDFKLEKLTKTMIKSINF